MLSRFAGAAEEPEGALLVAPRRAGDVAAPVRTAHA